MKEIRIGRHPQNDIVINDPCVGRNHCKIAQDGKGSFLLTDLNSINGTFLNGKRIRGTVRLSQNDVVRIGNTTLPWRNYFSIEQESFPPTVVQPFDHPSSNYPSNPTPRYERVVDRPLVDIPSEMNIKKEEHIISADVRKKGDDFSVGFRRKMGDNIGNHLGNTIGCIGSIILIIIFIAIIVAIGRGCS